MTFRNVLFYFVFLLSFLSLQNFVVRADFSTTVFFPADGKISSAIKTGMALNRYDKNQAQQILMHWSDLAKAGLFPDSKVLGLSVQVQGPAWTVPTFNILMKNISTNGGNSYSWDTAGSSVARYTNEAGTMTLWTGTLLNTFLIQGQWTDFITFNTPWFLDSTELSDYLLTLSSQASAYNTTAKAGLTVRATTMPLSRRSGSDSCAPVTSSCYSVTDFGDDNELPYLKLRVVHPDSRITTINNFATTYSYTAPILITAVQSGTCKAGSGSSNVNVAEGTISVTSSQYQSSDSCTWTLTSTEGKPIRVTFTQLDIEHDSYGDCYDYVTLYDGTTVSSTYRIPGKFPYICNYRNPVSAGWIFASTKPDMKVVWTTDGIVTKSGWVLQYTTGSELVWRYYTINLPVASSALMLVITSLSGSVFAAIRAGSLPTWDTSVGSADYDPTMQYANTTTPRTISYPNAAAGQYYIGFYGTTRGWSVSFQLSVPAPTIDSISPQTSDTTPLVDLTINGRDFGPVGTVYLGPYTLTCPTWLPALRIVCTIPKGEGASLNVRVVPGGGYPEKTCTGCFSYNAPSVLQVTPGNGPTTGGTSLQIDGTNFGITPSVTIDGKACTVQAGFTSTKLFCTTPANSGRTLPLIVTVAERTGQGTFSYDAPVLSNVAPQNLIENGTITLTGANFGGVLSDIAVSVGGKSCPVITLSTPHQVVTCKLPAGQVGTSQLISISVRGQAGTATLGYNYASPVISNISSTNGPTTGTYTVQITGTNLQTSSVATLSGPNGANPSPTTMSSVLISPGVLSAVMIAGEGRNREIRVDGSNTLAFNYDPPSITNINPQNGSTVGNQFITLTGKNFGARGSLAVPSVTIASAACTYVSHTDAQIVCRTPPGAGASQSVIVTQASQQSTAALYSYWPPRIANVTPSVGTSNSLVTIIGAEFGQTSQLSVFIGSQQCALSETNNATHAVCIVPPGQGVQPVTVRVTNGASVQSGGGGSTCWSLNTALYSDQWCADRDGPTRCDVAYPSNCKVVADPTFTYELPAVFGVAYTSAPTKGGVPITITGQYFGTSGTVTIGGGTCTTGAQWTQQQIICTLPAGQGVNQSLVVTSGQSSSPFNFSYDPPQLTSAAPSLPTTGGTLTIAGNNFGSKKGSVLIASSNCTVLTWDHQSIIVAAPEGQGSSSVSVYTGDSPARVATLATGLVYQNPVIDQITPASLPTAGGYNITITGNNFGKTTLGPGTVLIDLSVISLPAAQCTISTRVHDQIVCLMPAGQGVNIPLSVTISGLTLASFRTISYLGPTLNNINSTGLNGLVLNGNNFGVNPVVTVGDASCPLDSGSVQTHTRLVCIFTPTSPTAQVTVRVETQQSSLSYTFPTPIMNQVIPNTGPTQGGIFLVIYGTNLGIGSPNVKGLVCPVNNRNESFINCTLPAGSGRGDLILDGPLSSNTLSFSYFAPDITSLSPTSVPTEGTILNITGTDFTSNPTVQVGSQSCTPITKTPTFISCSLPAITATGQNVTVIVIADQLASAGKLLNFNAPSITQMTPTTGVAAGQTLVTLQGSSFGPPNGVVTINGQTCLVNLVGTHWTHTTIVCRTPAGAGTSLPVVVRTVSGLSATNNSILWTYSSPQISGVTPPNSPTQGGITVTIEGVNFGSNTDSVTIGGVPCSPTSWTDSRILCITPSGVGIPTPLRVIAGGQYHDYNFAYQAPVITSIHPLNAPTQGNVPITVQGSNFGASSTGFSFRIGSTVLPVTFITPHQNFSAIIPQGIGAGKDVSVDVSGQIYTLPKAFSYLPPTVTSISSSSCQALGPNQLQRCPTTTSLTLTISGTSFGNAVDIISVQVGSQSCTGISLPIDHSQIICTIAPYQEGGLNIPITVTVDSQVSDNFIGLNFLIPLIVANSITCVTSPYCTQVNTSSIHVTPSIANPVTIELIITDIPTPTILNLAIRYGTPGVGFLNKEFECEVTDVELLSGSNYKVTCVIGGSHNGVGAGSRLTFQAQMTTGLTSNDGTDTIGYPTPELIPNSIRTSITADPASTVVGSSSLGDNVYFNAANVGTVNSILLIRYHLVGTGQSDSDPECLLPSILNPTDPDPKQLRCVTQAVSGSLGPYVFRITINGANSLDGTDTFFYATAANVSGVSGCTPDPTDSRRTINCPTTGGIPLQVSGTGFSAGLLNVVQIGTVYCRKVVYVSPTVLNCTLPPGTGFNLPVFVIANRTFSAPQNLLSYALPIITTITGCPMDSARCARTGQQITLTGNNFGSANAKVLVNGLACTNPTHSSTTPDSRLTCMLPPGNSSRALVRLVQAVGGSSNAVMLSYAPCPLGTIDVSPSNCSACPEGSYNAIEGATSCVQCPSGYRSPSGASSCSKCPRGTYSLVAFGGAGVANCTICPQGYYTPSSGATSCQECPYGTYNNLSTSQGCFPCPVGFYADSMKSTACAPCPLGTYSVVSGAVQCTSCPAGTYSNQTNSVTCLTCPAGQRTSTAGQANCVPCDPGYYTPAGGIQCLACDNGYFSNTTGSESCSACLPGFYSIKTEGLGTTSCTKCSVGTFTSISSQRACQSCLPGTIAADVGAIVCAPCAAGLYQQASGKSSCFSCDPGTYSLAGATACSPCPAGTRWSNGTCITCGVGTYQPLPSRQTCDPCPSGSYSFQPGSTSCTACSSGSYAEQPGLSSCSPCAPGKFSLQSGSSGPVNCTDCDWGYTTTISGQSICTPCAAGYYGEFSQRQSCVRCPSGTYASIPGQTGCTNCSQGLYASSTGANACNPCPSGKFASGTGNSDCIPCPPGSAGVMCQLCPFGQYADRQGQAACLPCSPGYFTNTTGSITCQPCPEGTYQSNPGDSECVPCIPGTITASSGLPECEKCLAGYFNNISAQAVCQSCPLGKYSDSTGLTVCQDCAVGYYDTESLISCAPCPAGRYSDAPGSVQCQPCLKGKHQPEVAQASCDPCGPGTYTSDDNSVSCLPCELGSYTDTYGSTVCSLCGVGTSSNATGSAMCQECTPGKFGTITGISACSNCDPGRYNNVTNSSACFYCEAGFYQAMAGQSSCTPCARGYATSLAGQTSCQACQAGFFSGSEQLTECTKCLEGTYTPRQAGGASVCHRCDPGWYQGAQGQDRCVPCPLGTAGNVTGLSSCSLCAAGTYTQNLASSECLPCQSGTFASLPGSSSCTDCLRGYFANVTGKSICTECEPGFYQDMDARSACIPCPQGTSARTPGQTSCSGCAIGKYSNVFGLVECYSCEAGYYTQTDSQITCTSCTYGTSRSEKQDTCTPCLEGTMAGGLGASECTLCQPGFFQSQPGASVCEPCAPGSYSTSHAIECTACSAGKYANDTGASSCVECPPGYYQNTSGASTCLGCPAGNYSQGGATSCLPCELGTFASDVNQTQCTACRAGYFAPRTGMIACLECVAGLYTETPKNSICSPCPNGTYGVKLPDQISQCISCEAGKFQTSVGQLACRDCEIGYFASIAGKAVCDPCPRGSFANTTRATTCAACPATQFQNTMAASGCLSCSPGKYNENNGQTECTPCKPGYYQNLTGQSACDSCNAGFYQPDPESTMCKPCEAGYSQSGQRATACEPCASGKYNNGSSPEICRNCEPGHMQNAEGQASCIACLPGRFSTNGGSSCPSCNDSNALTFNPYSGAQKCIPCLDNQVPNPGFTYCLCKQGYYDAANIDFTNFNGTLNETNVSQYLRCYPCPLGANCNDKGVTFANMQAQRGYWRANNQSLTFYRCQQQEYCAGGVNSECASNRVGPICAFCKPGYHSTTGSGACVACPSQGSAIGFIFFVALLVCCVFVLMYVAVIRNDDASLKIAQAKLAQQSQARQSIRSRALTEIDELTDTDAGERSLNESGAVTTQPAFTAKLKIMLGFFQVVSNLAFRLAIPWPTAFEKFMSFLNIVNLDILQWASVDCVVKSDYYLKYTILVLAPIVLLILVFCFYLLPSYIKDLTDYIDDDSQRNIRADRRRKFWKLIIFTTFLLYPSVSSVVLKLYVCQRIADQSYLVADFTIHCYDGKWLKYAGANAIFILLYPVGIPAVFGYILWKHRNSMHQPGFRLQYGFLFDAYTDQHWWFELMDIGNKLFLTSILAFFPSSSQVPIGLGWNMSFSILILLTQPYIRKSDDRLHLVAQIELFLVMLMAWVLTNPQKTIPPAVDTLLSILCISITVAIALLFILQLTIAIRKILYKRAMDRLNARLVEERSQGSGGASGGSQVDGEENIVINGDPTSVLQQSHRSPFPPFDRQHSQSQHIHRQTSDPPPMYERQQSEPSKLDSQQRSQVELMDLRTESQMEGGSRIEGSRHGSHAGDIVT